MAYRPSSKPPETAWARHLDQVRREHDWSAAELFRQSRVAIDLGPESRSTFVAELHHDPKAHWIAGLVKLFGEPDVTPEITPDPQPDLAAALMALALELKAAREERARYLALEGTVTALKETVAGLLRSSRKAGGSGASRAGRAPRGSAG